jgi:hypothetical protein
MASRPAPSLRLSVSSTPLLTAVRLGQSRGGKCGTFDVLIGASDGRRGKRDGDGEAEREGAGHLVG